MNALPPRAARRRPFAPLPRGPMALLLLVALLWVLPGAPPVPAQGSDAWRSAQRWYEAAQRYEQDGDLNVAISLYGSVVEQYAQHFGARYALGRLLLQSDPGRAREHLRAARDIRPTSAQVNFLLGQAQEADGALLEAAESYRQTIRINAHHTQANARLRGVLRQLRAQQGAIGRAEELFWDNPNLAGLMLYGRVVMRHATPRQALLEFEALRGRAPQLPEVELWIARAHRQLGDEAGEIRAYRRYVEQQPHALNVRLALADRLVAAGRYRDAQETLARLREVNGDPADYPQEERARAAFLRSRVDAGLGRTDDALDALLAASRDGLAAETIDTAFRDDLARLPDRPRVAMAYGRWLDGQGRGADAAATLQEPCTTVADYRDACTALLEPLAEPPAASSRARVVLGELALQAGDARRAVRYLEAVPAGDPADGDASLRLGMLYRQRGDLNRSIDAFTRYVFSFPTRREMHFARGNIFWKTGKPEDAIAYWLRRPDALTEQPTALRQAAAWLQQQDGRSADERMVRDMLRQAAPGDLPNLVRLGQLQHQAGENAAAVAVWRQVLDAAPGDDVLLLDLHRELNALGETALARRALWQAAQVRTLSPDLTAGLAASLIAQGQQAEALQLYWQLYRENSNHEAARLALPELVRQVPAPAEVRMAAATIAQESGQTALAVDLLDELLAVAPGHAGARLQLARLLLEAGSPGQALRTLEDWPQPPPSPERLALMADAQRGLGRPDAEAATLRELVAMDPDNLPQARRLALLLVQLQADAEALPLLRRTVERAPADTELRLALAHAERRTGHPQAAAAAYRQVLQAAPTELTARRGLAEALQAAGDDAGTAQALEDLLSMQPTDTDARETLIRTYLRLYQPQQARPHYDVLTQQSPSRARRLALYFR